MGDQVAFKVAPELHLAAHEAAHTMQQAQGVQLKGGIGQAGDAYERQADEAADLVVAGKPADHLFGVGAETGASSQVVQRREASPTEDEESDTRIQVIRLSLLNAQHWLDKAVVAMRKDDDLANDDAATIAATIGMVRRHFGEAHEAYSGHGKDLDKSKLAKQMDETSRALGEFTELVLLSSSPHASDGTMLDELLETEQDLRMYFDLGAYPTKKGHKRAAKKDDVYEGQALGPVLDLANVEAHRTYEALLPDSKKDNVTVNRNHVIGEGGLTILSQLVHALWLLKVHEGKGEAKTYGPKIERVSASILQIQRWIFGRQDSAGLLESFAPTVRTLNKLRAAVDLEPVAKDDEPKISQEEYEEESVEKGGVDKAEKIVAARMGAALDGVKVGADRFFEFSKLKRPPEPPDVWAELAKGVLISVLGNFAGPAMGAIVKGMRRKGFDAMAEATISFVAGTTTDSVEAMAGTLADGAVSSAGSENQDIRDRKLFADGLVLTQAQLKASSAEALAIRVADKTVSEAELMEMAFDAQAASAEVADVTYRKAAHGFALLCAREGLGAEKNAAGEDVSDLDSYFGKWETGRSRRGKQISPDKRGTTGVAKLTVEVFDTGDDAGYEIKKFAIHGLNDDMAISTLENCEYQLAQLGLPLEVHFNKPFGGWSENPMMVINEAGGLHTWTNWVAFDPPLQRNNKIKRAPNAELYLDPNKMWKALHGDTIPKSAASISKDG